MKRRLTTAALVVALLIGGCTATLYRPSLPPATVEAEYAAAPSTFEQLAGSRVHVRDEGDGPTLVLLHGTGASLHTWDAWLRVLGNGFRIIRVDLQGFGLTGPNDDRDYSIDRQIEVIDALMARRNITSWAVAGNSLGGLIAWRWAAREPERISHTILLAPAGAPRDPATPREQAGFRMIDLAKIPGVREVTMKLTPRFLVRRGLEQVYGDPSRLDDATVRRYHRMLLRRGNRQALADAMSGRGRGSTASRPNLSDVPAAHLDPSGARSTPGLRLPMPDASPARCPTPR